jgi:NADP-dependent 3-hydroxy acid dehydrogenase YdfG
MASPEVVVITGASAGVGRAIARLFAERGSDVSLVAHGRDGLALAAYVPARRALHVDPIGALTSE